MPSYKYLSFVNAEDRQIVHSEMRSMIDKFVSSLPLVSDSTHTDSHSDQQPSSKRSKVESCDLLADFKTAATPLSNADLNDTRHGLDKYFSLPVPEMYSGKRMTVNISFRRWQ